MKLSSRAIHTVTEQREKSSLTLSIVLLRTLQCYDGVNRISKLLNSNVEHKMKEKEKRDIAMMVMFDWLSRKSINKLI